MRATEHDSYRPTYPRDCSDVTPNEHDAISHRGLLSGITGAASDNLIAAAWKYAWGLGTFVPHSAGGLHPLPGRAGEARRYVASTVDAVHNMCGAPFATTGDLKAIRQVNSLKSEIADGREILHGLMRALICQPAVTEPLRWSAG
jgi:hypothetical protein